MKNQSLKKFSFLKKNRLSNNCDFENVLKNGKLLKCKFFTLKILKNNLEYPRLGIRINKKIGNAVKRNKIKRMIKEIFRMNKNEFNENIDIVLIPYSNILSANFDTLNKEFLKLLNLNKNEFN